MNVGYTVKAPSIKSAYNQLIPLIFTYGSRVDVNGSKTVELLDTTVIISNPNINFSRNYIPSLIPKNYPLGKSYIQKYIQDLFYGSKSVFSYDYHNRLFNWKGKVNQINEIINRLKSDINSRRAVAITWYPDEDNYKDDVPCLQYIQFIIRDNKLFMKTLFRSNDALLAFPANCYGLMRIGLYISDKLNVKFDKYSHTSVSMHVYYERDFDYLKQYFPEIYKLIKGGKYE